MTVADLIAKLRETPQDAVVIVWDAYRCLHTPEGISLGSVIFQGDYATEICPDEARSRKAVKIN